MKRGSGDGIRVAELTAALSLATDLGLGQPLHRQLAVCLAAPELAERSFGGLGASAPPSLQGGPDEQPPQELQLAERPDPSRPELWQARDPLARLDPAAELGREHARQRSLARDDNLGMGIGR